MAYAAGIEELKLLVMFFHFEKQGMSYPSESSGEKW